MYVFPLLGGYEFVFFRLFGPGIGNSLLVWARAVVYSQKYNLKMLQPAWKNFLIGPIIRNQKDLVSLINIVIPDIRTNSVCRHFKIF